MTDNAESPKGALQGDPVRERYSGEYPELYCPGCIREFGQKVPAVFARRILDDGRVSYSVVCPVAGLETYGSGYLSHGGPHGTALGADGRRYDIWPETGLTSVVTTEINGRKRSYLSIRLSRWWNKRLVQKADAPGMGNATHAPKTAIVVDDFDWESLAEENRLKERVE